MTASLILAGSSLLWGAAAANRIPAGVDPEPLLRRAIQAGGITQMKAALDAGADPNARDADGTPMLMNAALYGTAAHMKLLLDRGADANARNSMEATALIWGAGDATKTRLLLASGADAHAVSRLGRTPLMAAASVRGNAASLRMLLAKGAKVDAVDNVTPIPVIPAGGGKGTALIDAARTGDVEMVRILLAAGANVNALDARSGTALSEAVVFGHEDMVRVLLEAGARPSVPVTMLRMPYMTLAAVSGNVAVARKLVAAGADVNGADVTGATPLMFAAASERDNVEMVYLLLTAGARVDARNKAGESAIDWASRRGETAIVRSLRKAGSPDASAVRHLPKPQQLMDSRTPAAQAVGAALAALTTSSPVAFKKSGCASCHNHTIPLVAMAAARRAGMPVDESQASAMVKYITSSVTPFSASLLEGSDTMPDLPVTGGYMLEAVQSHGMAANRMTAAIVQRLAMTQMPDGRWVGWAPRAPLEGGDIQATAMAIRAITLYPIAGRSPEMRASVARARLWLQLSARPVTTEEHTMRLLGLFWSGARPAKVAAAARQLARMQRPGGGWAQLPGLGTDAYATGKAMVALSQAMPAHRNAASMKEAELFLRRTQFADGTWQVATRAFPFQPLVDAGFPHGRDQWISAAATGWAAAALAMQPR